MSAGAFNRESLTRLLKDKATLERAIIYNLPLANRSHRIRFILMCPDDVQVRTQTFVFAFGIQTWSRDHRLKPNALDSILEK